MRKTTILITVMLAMFLLTSNAFCWEWEEVFRVNEIRFATVAGIPTSIPDQAASKFKSTDDDVTGVRLTICDGGGFPVHYHSVMNPVVNTTYDLVTTHVASLYRYEASMTVAGGNFTNLSEYVEAKITYPY